MNMKPIIESFRDNGEQRLYRFDNGYGASVIRDQYSYGGDKGLFELAVVKYHNADNDAWSLRYDTPITDDVIGHLTEAEVQALLEQIKALPAKED